MVDDNNHGDQGNVENEQPFITHLIELRNRLLHAVTAIFLIFAGLFYFSDKIYSMVAKPLLAHLPHGATMIATEVASPFLVPMKLTLVVAIFIAVPYLLYQMWAFVAPGLYAHEKRMILPLLISSTLLFYMGVSFAYFLVMPAIFKFFTAVAPQGVTVMTDISHYLDFVLTLFLAFGVAFEVPIATIVLVWIGVLTPQALTAKRPYVVVGIFIIAAILTPPDVFSQSMLAIPMWILFELGVFFSRYFVRKAGDDNAEEESAGDRNTEEESTGARGTEEEPTEEEQSMDEMLNRYIADERALQGPRDGQQDNEEDEK